MNFLRYKRIYFVFIGILSLASIASLAVFGLKLGIDFTGGSILELEYLADRPSNREIEEKLAGMDLGSLTLQPAGERGIIIRMKDITEETHGKIIQKLGKEAFDEKRFEQIGSVIGRELKQKTITLILASLAAIVFYIALAFRKVQRPVRSWEYALASMGSLFHDVIIPLGVFSVLGKFYGVEISIPVVAALLTVGGSSVNNVIVVFDRVRENLLKRRGTTFEDTVNKSLNETLGRCLNTSLCYLLPLLAIFFFGGPTLRYFSLTLIMGIAAGTYSAVLLAAPLLTIFKRHA